MLFLFLDSFITARSADSCSIAPLMKIIFIWLQVNTEILKENAEMINEYFSIHIDEDGNLTRLPVVLDQYTPDMDRLPEFVLTLGNDVGS